MEQIDHPFKLSKAFFAELHFKRPPAMPENTALHIGVQSRVVEDGLPERLEVQLKAETEGDSPLDIRVIVIGVFSLAEGASIPGADTVPDFVRNRAFHVLWSYIDQGITQATSMMGINPVCLESPLAFLYEPSSESTD
jgi:preprotein translocase subunit SecB